MAPKTNKIISPLVSCRYCLSDTIDHAIQYFITDNHNKYEEMLQDTFKIQICSSDNKSVCCECQEDITRAAEFKQRVLNAQRTQRNVKVSGPESPKQEISSDFEECYFEHSDDNNEAGADRTRDYRMGDTVTSADRTRDGIGDNEIGVDRTRDYEMGDSGTEADGTRDNRNKEAQDSTMKLSKTVKKAVVKIERMENDQIVTRKIPKVVPKVKKILSDAKNKNGTRKKKGKNNSKDETSKCLIQMKKNTLKLINNSNMCIFVTKKNKYGCYFCKETFLDIPKLRWHTKTHKSDKINRAINLNQGLSCKSVEISNLECAQCSYPCPDLDELRVHLTNKHGEVFDGAQHLLVPYKIENGFNCVICDMEFKSFLFLNIHMNSHSRTNVCEICGSSYVNRLGLRNHIYSVHTERKCNVCNIVLPSNSARVRHMRLVHSVNGYANRRCLLCDMVFPYSYRLKKHMIEKHGFKRPEYACESCDKVFIMAVRLRTHYKSVHMGERKHLCDFCDMSFFTTTDKKRHEMTHGSEKPFSCDICKVKFRAKDSLRRHFKKQHDGKNI